MNKSIEERLKEKTIIQPPIDCWLFIGAQVGASDTGTGGHGIIFYNGKLEYVHRISAHLFLGFNLNSELQINHIQACLHKNCWNPRHLYIGTQLDNMKDVVGSRNNAQSRRTHCPQGHEYTAENTYTYKNERGCKICRKKRTDESNRKRKIR